MCEALTSSIQPSLLSTYHLHLCSRLQHQQLAAAQLAHSRHQSGSGSSKMSASPRRCSETSHSPTRSDDSDSSISLGVPSPGPHSLSLGPPSPTPNNLSLGSPPPPSTIGTILPPYTNVPPSLPIALHRPFSSSRLSWYSAIHPLVPGWWIGNSNWYRASDIHFSFPFSSILTVAYEEYHKLNWRFVLHI